MEKCKYHREVSPLDGRKLKEMQMWVTDGKLIIEPATCRGRRRRGYCRRAVLFNREIVPVC